MLLVLVALTALHPRLDWWGLVPAALSVLLGIFRLDPLPATDDKS